MKQCTKGHISDFYTNGRCKQCHKICMSKYRRANIEAIKEANKIYKIKNKEKIKQYALLTREVRNKWLKQWKKKNPDKYKASMKRYRQSGKAYINGLNYELRKKKAMPIWTNKIELEHFYIQARQMSDITTSYHVDHIVPLGGKIVCGLHVPWNLQILPSKENQSKGNRI